MSFITTLVKVEYGAELAMSGVVSNFIGNSDDRKMVSLSRAFTRFKIRVNRTNQIVRIVAAVLPTCKQICFLALTLTANSRMESHFLHLSYEPKIILVKH